MDNKSILVLNQIIIFLAIHKPDIEDCAFYKTIGHVLRSA